MECMQWRRFTSTIIKNRAHVRILKAIFFVFLCIRFILIYFFSSPCCFAFNSYLIHSCHPWMRISYGNWFHKIAVINFRFDYFICFLFGGRIRCAMSSHFKWHEMCIFMYHYCFFFILFIFVYVFVSSYLCVHVNFMTYSRKVDIRIAKCGMCA